ncbi:alpha/beta fold hydrolase [Mesorhizobium loti]|uniref:Alpha/beta hydrolase n=1 Tax=Mesorhizobium loti R88b TaxID=935548 RepID=A0A6M7WDS8_RHILI|nr:alpha/beta hydrolase [Mesorhizobium loti]QKD01950.1 alpha/beta hydrolase [Mesorhizobium loti R88b]
MTTKVENRKVAVWGGEVELNFQIRGSGPVLIYFHPAAGLGWDPFLERLAEIYTVYAPEFPGTTIGDPYAINQVDGLNDAVLMYEEAIRILGLSGAVAVGQSFGGMMSIEIAATFPGIFSRLVVLDPIGLWNEGAPTANWIEASPQQLPQILFKNPDSAAARAMLAMPEDPAIAVKVTAQLIWNLGCTGKLVWPIPERGMRRRLHRVNSDTLIVWGEDDALISASYADELSAGIVGSRVELIANCGHIPQVEQLEITYDLVTNFLHMAQKAA